MLKKLSIVWAMYIDLSLIEKFVDEALGEMRIA